MGVGDGTPDKERTALLNTLGEVADSYGAVRGLGKEAEEWSKRVKDVVDMHLELGGGETLRNVLAESVVRLAVSAGSEDSKRDALLGHATDVVADDPSALATIASTGFEKAIDRLRISAVEKDLGEEETKNLIVGLGLAGREAEMPTQIDHLLDVSSDGNSMERSNAHERKRELLLEAFGTLIDTRHGSAVAGVLGECQDEDNVRRIFIAAVKAIHQDSITRS